MEVAAAIGAAAQGVVTTGEVAEAMGIPGENVTVVRKELENFARANLLARLPRPRGERIQRYERLPSAYWDLAAALLQEASLAGDNATDKRL